MVSFELAQLVFADPLHMTSPDPSDSEVRWRTIGMVGNVAIFVVHTEPVFTEDGLIGRIISARKATTRERRIYEYGE